MCRLLLMNAQAASSLGEQNLHDLLAYLQQKLGGDGNGVAALWEGSGAVQVRKGLRLTPPRAAHLLETFAMQGAQWLLFHTRKATWADVATRHCHPFRYQRLVLAHNGHDHTFAALAQDLGLSDSACIALTWARVHLPLTALLDRSGVFIGFQHGHPFVMKGQCYTQLVLASEAQTGALLFASELPLWLSQGGWFDRIVQLGRLAWTGESALDLEALTRRPSWAFPGPWNRSWTPLYSGGEREDALLEEEDLRAALERMDAALADEKHPHEA